MKKIYDLTHEVYSGMPVYPGDPEVRMEQASSIAKDGYVVSRLELGTHNSTHIDAQCHMVEGGKSLSDYPMDRFIGEGIYTNTKSGIRKSEIIIIDGLYFDKEVLGQLIELNPKMVGFTSDEELDEDGVRTLLKHDILPVGPLNIREPLPYSFTFIAMPLKLKEGDGSPVRAIVIES